MGSPSPEEASLMQFKKAVEDHWEDPLNPHTELIISTLVALGPQFIYVLRQREIEMKTRKSYIYII